MIIFIIILIFSCLIIIINDTKDYSLELQKKNIELKSTIISVSSKVRQKGTLDKIDQEEILGLSKTLIFTKKIDTNYKNNDNYLPIDAIQLYIEGASKNKLLKKQYQYILNTNCEIYVNNIIINKEMIEHYSNYLESNFDYKHDYSKDIWPCHEAKILNYLL